VQESRDLGQRGPLGLHPQQADGGTDVAGVERTGDRRKLLRHERQA
jgi:hypothetical protein